MYQRFRWKRLIAHYITSSPTTATGDVMFYHQKNRNSVFLSQTSAMLLPFVLSDEDTVIGPQWTNHSVDLHIKPVWKSTDYGMSSVSDDYCEGELFLLSKTSTTDSPGYVIFDYEIEFAELQITPRLLALPLPRAMWSQLNLGMSAAGAVTQFSTKVDFVPINNNLSGATSALPTGAAVGDIYKIILDVTNSNNVNSGAWVLLTAANVFGLSLGIVNETLPVVDGTTLYGVLNASSQFQLYANIESAVTNGNNYLTFGSTQGATAFITFQCWISLCTTVGTTNTNPNF